jgi:Ca2+-binding RTX toxin-like protein
MQIDTSNDSTITLTATGGDSLLSVVGNSTAILIGGSGGTDLLFGGGGPTTLIVGTGNDFLFAGTGATIFIDNRGDNYMKGGSGADTFTFADVNSGHDIIANFKTGMDVLKITANLSTSEVTSAAELVSDSSVVDGSTVLHLGPDHDVTTRGIDTPSTLVNSIIAF